MCNSDEVCNRTCRERKPNVVLSRDSSSGVLRIVTSSSDGENRTVTLNDDYGIASYDYDQHHCEIVEVSSSGISGIVITSTSQSPIQSEQSGSSGRRVRRSVTNTTANNIAPNQEPDKIPSPFICIGMGSAILFQIEINQVNRSLSHYPRYNKDHLLNKNDRFDYGYFRFLHSIVRDTNKSLTTFANVFNQDGVFIFYDNALPTSEMIVKVTGLGEKCSETLNNEMLPVTSLTLTQYRVGKSKVSATKYSWGFEISNFYA